MNQKKYILKPGKHQFAPSSPAVHDNDTLTDKEAEWYIEKYPHIQSLFVPTGQTKEPHQQQETAFPIKVGAIINKPSIESQSVESSATIGATANFESVKSPAIISVIQNKDEDLPATN